MILKMKKWKIEKLFKIENYAGYKNKILQILVIEFMDTVRFKII